MIVRDTTPNQPLLLAAYFGLFENVKALVVAGADINVRDILDSAPELALDRGRYDIAAWLLQQGYRNNLPRLALSAEVCHVPLNSPSQRSKEQLIGLLRAKGMVFPSHPATLRALKERQIPSEAVEDIIMGRRLVLEFPYKPGFGK